MNFGLLDLLNPLFAVFDQAIEFFPGFFRLMIWALISAIVSMVLYRMFSKQDELAELKPKIKSVQRDMARYDGPLDGLWPLIFKSMRLSGRQMGLTLKPALIASLPVLFVLAFLSNAYGYRLPAPGDTIEIRAEGAERPGRWAWNHIDAASFDSGTASWRIAWPDDKATLSAPGYGAILELPFAHASTVIHKRKWWNWLIGNPVGYLPDDAPLEAFHFDLARQDFLPFGPAWLGYWEVIYIGLLVVFSVAIKLLWKIH